MSNAERPGFLSGATRDYCAGGLMVVVGAAAAIQGYTYQVGTLSQMGSGFFPVSLGVILICVGLAIAAFARHGQTREIVPEVAALKEASTPEWRGWFCILASILAFTILGQYGGLLIATFAMVFIAAMGDRGNTWRSALVLALIMSAMAVVVFWWLLQVQFPLFSWGQSL